MRPFAAIYSTFVQRAFDQVWQEVVLNQLPVVFCMDRAGFVGDDGAVHHGFMDQAFLRPLPGMVLMAPSDEAELNRAVRLALSLETASAIRYPRDNVPARNFEEVIDPNRFRTQPARNGKLGRSRVLRRRHRCDPHRLRRAGRERDVGGGGVGQRRHWKLRSSTPGSASRSMARCFPAFCVPAIRC